ncbi:MAG: DEAD/DEAH box helicase [Candidatus Saccharimonadales bacterium]
MDMTLINPSKISLPSDDESVKRFLTYHDRSVDYQISVLKKRVRWAHADPDSYKARMDELKSQSTKSLLHHDENGNPWTYSGLWKELNQRFGWNLSRDELDVSKVGQIPWLSIPREPRYYQKDTVEALLKNRHASACLPMGAGKTLIIEMLAKAMPVQTMVVTPSGPITDQIYKKFLEHFGPKYVGKYGDGKKHVGKLFTIATGQALAWVKPDSEAADYFSKTRMLIWDEAHTTPATQFDEVCMGLLINAELRFFLSATLCRPDGSEMLLKGITGPVVYTKDFNELVTEGYLAQPVFKVFRALSNGATGRSDPNAETRAQLYNNPNVNRLAGQIATKCVTLAKRQTLVMIEEYDQFLHLLNHITIPFEFIHGPLSAETKKKIPSKYWESNIEGVVNAYNAGKLDLIVGTSAVSTGVDLPPVRSIIYCQGGTSEIQIPQAIGRGTRMCEGKTDFWVSDFRVVGSKTMERHVNARIDMFSTMGTVTEYGL